MKILIACEESGEVTKQFIERGHDAMSCDIIPSRKQVPHYMGDVRDILNDKWDMIIAFPPCTDLCVSGARWFPEKIKDGRQQNAIDFFMLFVNHPCEKIAIENPIGIMSTNWRKPDQIIQPWMFGHGETKATCIWLKGLPKLEPTEIVNGRKARIHRMSPGPNRAKERAKTFSGIAQAMADQWG